MVHIVSTAWIQQHKNYVGVAAVSTYPAGMGKEMVADGLDVAVVGMTELSDGLEVLFGSPTLREDWERQRDCHRSHNGVVVGRVEGVMGRNKF